MSARGWRDVRHNVRLAHVQVDIVARSPGGVLTLIEVKMQGARGLARLSGRQAARLYRVAEALALDEPVELMLALVEEHKVRLLSVDALTDF